MSIKSITNGYEVDCRPQGRNGKRYRKKFTTIGEAQKYERWLLSTQNQKNWVEKSADKRPLLELINLCGQQLKTGKKATTINRNQTRLSSVFTALMKAEEFHNQHPLKG